MTNKEENINQIVLASQLDQVQVSAELIQSKDFLQQYNSLDSLITYLTQIKKTVDGGIKEIIEKNYHETGEASIKTDEYSFTYVSGGISQTFDSVKFKEEHPDLYAKYIKVSSKTDSLRVTKSKKKNKKDDSVLADFKELDF